MTNPGKSPAQSSQAFRRAAPALLLFAVAVVAIASLAQYRFNAELKVLTTEAPWLTLATMVAVWAARPGSLALVDRLAAPVDRLSQPQLLWVLGGVSLAVLLLIARFVLDRFPNSGDEYTYILQAETYARGRLWAPAPPNPAFFDLERLFVKDGIWISPYQPGWPVVLAPFALLHLPLWIVSPLIGAGMVVAFNMLARRLVSERAAWFATLAMATSPFFLLNLSSYFSHGVGAFAAVGFALFAVIYFKNGGAWAALLAGVCLGYLGFVRAYNAAFLALPFVITALLTPGRRMGLVWLGIGGAPFLGALLGYYALVTGHPLLPVQEWYNRGNEPVGELNARSTFETVRRLVRLYFWTSPVFAVTWPAALVWLGLKRRLHMVDWLLPTVLAGYVFYGGTGGNQYGPRYLFEAWPFAVITVMRAADPLLFAGPAGRRSTWAAAALLVHLTFQLSWSAPRFVREHQVIVERQDLYREVEQAKLSNAVVLISEPIGVIRPLWIRDAARNGLSVPDRSVIYALDLGPRNAELRAQFPGRRFLAYRGGRLRDLP